MLLCEIPFATPLVAVYPLGHSWDMMVNQLLNQSVENLSNINKYTIKSSLQDIHNVVLLCTLWLSQLRALWVYFPAAVPPIKFQLRLSWLIKLLLSSSTAIQLHRHTVLIRIKKGWKWNCFHAVLVFHSDPTIVYLTPRIYEPCCWLLLVLADCKCPCTLFHGTPAALLLCP